MGKAARLAMVGVMSAALIGGVPAVSQGGTARVKAVGTFPNFSWQPPSKTVAKGTTVIWKNATSSKHSVTAYRKGWSKNTVIQAGEKTKFRFKHTGTYFYFCRFHSHVSNGQCSGSMCGKIKVTS
ncbi:MAG: plastocyanin/azurin family copper-binding protein [Actinomycetota bacterium]|nr:plastocyanin/azurin family copper-binding protein [Actinomycetota bacterium]